jgi:hypothetical protein
VRRPLVTQGHDRHLDRAAAVTVGLSLPSTRLPAPVFEKA